MHPSRLPHAILLDLGNVVFQVSFEAALAGFTNTNAAHAPIWKRKYRDQLAGFVRIFESQAIRLRKPEPRAFLHVAAEMGFRAEDVLFVDDLRDNVEAARGIGMQTVWLPAGVDLRRELELRGILPV